MTSTIHNFTYLHKFFKVSLKKHSESKSIHQLKEDYDSLKSTDVDKKAALDQSFRDLLMVEISDIENVANFIDFSIEACRQDMVTSTIPVVLLGDVFDATTLDKCETMFNYVERNVSVWKEEYFFSSCKNNLLRMCNDLLRRLSRSQNTVFCGRILLFLAQFFPFSERSGLNIVSEFNLENLTEYDNESKELTDTVNDQDVVKVQIDYNLYCKFWALQDYFRNPNQCYNKVQWKTFSMHSTTVLSAFASFKLEDTRHSSSSTTMAGTKLTTNGDGPSNMEVETTIHDSQHFFAKFLTNPKLLSLQLADSNFRRSVLVQFLILFQYLSSTVKFKAETFVLSQSQMDWIKETETQIYKLVEETPPHGRKFAATVKHMLQREELWNNWKNDGCKEFKRPDSVSEETTGKPPLKRPKKLLGDLVRDASKQGKFYMGNPELTRLWNLCPDNLQSCKGEDRNFLPSLETYLENPKEKNDPSFEWRALRLLARQSPHFFTLISTPSYKVSDYLDTVHKKIQKDKNEVKTGIVMSQTLETEIKDEQIEETETETDGFPEEQIEDTELLKPEQLSPDENNAHKPTMITPDQLMLISPIIGNDWKKLATKLGYDTIGIRFFETENPKLADQCMAMLRDWFDEDVDANLDNLAYIMEGLGLISACEAVKKFIPSSNDKGAEDISD